MALRERAGKPRLLILPRFYDPCKSGQILRNGPDRDVALKDLRRHSIILSTIRSRQYARRQFQRGNEAAAKTRVRQSTHGNQARSCIYGRRKGWLPSAASASVFHRLAPYCGMLIRFSTKPHHPTLNLNDKVPRSVDEGAHDDFVSRPGLSTTQNADVIRIAASLATRN